MIFSSPEFCFLFLPVVLVVYYILQFQTKAGAAKNWLIAASLFFYAWWSLTDTAILSVLLVINYWLTTGIIRSKNAGLVGAAKYWRNFGVILNVIVLIFFKYLAFILLQLDLPTMSHTLSTIALPLGISFFIFQKIAILVDSEAKEIPLPSFRNFVLFVLFFPQLIAGPIVHHSEMMPQLDRMGARRSRALDFSVGATQFTLGLAKKLIIADGMSGFVTPIFKAADMGVPITLIEAWGAILAYGMQIYFDFSGYSDMALGLARMFGIRLPVNFYSPYKSSTIIEFWRRWHMTLSRFLRDYVYIPLGGNRLGEPRRYLNLVLTMLIGGLWHGANWTFLAWGAAHGLALAITHLFTATRPRVRNTVAKAGGRLGTFLFVMLTWVLFRADSVDSAVRLYRAVAGLNGLAPARILGGTLAPLVAALHLAAGGEFVLSGYEWATVGAPRIALALAIALAMPNSHQILHRYRPALFGSFKLLYAGRDYFAWRPTALWLSLTITLFGIATLHMSTVSEFLYFKF